MKQTALFVVLLFVSFAAQAQQISCLEKLLPFSRHSGLHQLDKTEWNDGKETLDAAAAENALNALVNSKLLCRAGEVEIKIFPVCLPLIMDVLQSNTCFIFTNLGYFVITKDAGKNTNFIFSKDNQFSPPAP